MADKPLPDVEPLADAVRRERGLAGRDHVGVLPALVAFLVALLALVAVEVARL